MKFNYYRRTVILNYFAYGTTILIGFFLFPLVLKQLGWRQAGILAFFYSFKSILDMGIGWLSGSIVKNLIEFRSDSIQINTFSFIINYTYGLLCVLLFSLLAILFFSNYFSTAFFFSLYACFSFFSIPLTEILLSKYRQDISSLLRFTQQVIFLVMILFLFWKFKVSNINIIFILMGASAFIVFVLSFFYCKFRYKFSIDIFSMTKKMAKKLLITDGVRYFFLGISNVLVLQIDVLVISFFYGAKATAIYTIIWKIAGTILILIWQFIDPFQLEAKKLMQKNNLNTLGKLLRNYEKRIVLISLMIIFLYVFFGKKILILWVGSPHVPVLPFMYIVPALIILFMSVQRLYVSILYYNIGINTIIFCQIFIILSKALSIIFFFSVFRELTSLYIWIFVSLLTLFLLRKKALELCGE